MLLYAQLIIQPSTKKIINYKQKYFHNVKVICNLLNILGPSYVKN